MPLDHPTVLRDISGQVERIVYMLEQLDAEYTNSKLLSIPMNYQAPIARWL